VQQYLSGLFTAGALAVIGYAKIHGTEYRLLLTALARQPTNIARMAKSERYKASQALPLRGLQVSGCTLKQRREAVVPAR
jgi:hypothetical protein